MARRNATFTERYEFKLGTPTWVAYETSVSERFRFFFYGSRSNFRAIFRLETLAT